MTELGTGIVTGVAIITGTVGVLIAMGGGDVSILSNSLTETLSHALVGSVHVAGVAIILELLFNGFVLKNALEGSFDGEEPDRLRVTAIVGIIATLYAVLPVSHGVGIGTLDRFIYFWLFGVLTGSTYVITGRLSLPIGLHFGHEFARSRLFDFDPSISADLFVPVVEFSPIGHGLGSSPTGPIASIVLLLGLIGTLLWLKKRDGHLSIDQGFDGRDARHRQQ